MGRARPSRPRGTPFGEVCLTCPPEDAASRGGPAGHGARRSVGEEAHVLGGTRLGRSTAAAATALVAAGALAGCGGGDAEAAERSS